MDLIFTIIASICILFEPFTNLFFKKPSHKYIAKLLLVVVALSVLWGNFSFQRHQQQKSEQEISDLKEVAPKLLPNGRLELGSGISVSSPLVTETNQIRLLLQEKKYEEAYNQADRLIQKKRSFGLGYFLKGTAEIEFQRYEAGENNIQKAIELGLDIEDEGWAYHNLAVAAIRQGKLDEAMQKLRIALDKRPDLERSKNLLEELEEIQSTRLLEKYSWGRSPQQKTGRQT